MFIFVRNVDTLPRIHWFEMKKHGNGWQTISYTTDLCKVQFPLKTEIRLPTKNYETLSKIKKQFNAPFTCIVDCHLTAPSTFYQLVVEDITMEQRDSLIQYLTIHREGLYCDYHIDIKWLDDMPSEMYKTLSAY